MMLQAILCVHHTQVLGRWAELLGIQLEAAAVLPHQSVLRGQSQSSSCEPPKASAILPLEPGRAWSLVGRCRQKGHGLFLHGHQNLLLTL